MIDSLQLLCALIGTGVMISMPLVVVFGIPLAGFTVWRWTGLRQKELEVRRIEAAVHLMQSQSALPGFVDASDPRAVESWHRARRELALATA